MKPEQEEIASLNDTIFKLLEGKTLRDKLHGEDYDATKLSKKVGKNQYMFYNDLFHKTTHFIVKEKYISILTKHLDPARFKTKLEEDIHISSNDKFITKEFLWYPEGTKLSTIRQYINNLLDKI